MIGVTIRTLDSNVCDSIKLKCRKNRAIFTFVEEEYEVDVVVNTKPKMSWDEEDSDDNANQVKESWDDSEEEEGQEESPAKAAEKKAETVKAPVKKNLTLKQKIAEKEAILKEQRAKKIALVSMIDNLQWKQSIDFWIGQSLLGWWNWRREVWACSKGSWY